MSDQQSNSPGRVVRCLHCELVQHRTSDRCRRCHKDLRPALASTSPPQYNTSRAYLEKAMALCEAARGRKEPVLFGETLPQADTLVRLLVAEAVARTGSAMKAAETVGLGKTTVYRMLRELEMATQGQVEVTA